MRTQREQMKGVDPWLVRWACRAGTRDFCSAFIALVGPEQKMFLLTVHFQFFGPIAQQAGRAAMLGRLSLSTCLWHLPPPRFHQLMSNMTMLVTVYDDKTSPYLSSLYARKPFLVCSQKLI
jgi:hypothetical protein